MAARRLRDSAELLVPAVAALGEALDCPAADVPLLVLARRFASVIDSMPDAVAMTMLPNHSGPLIKILAELESRAVRRRAKPAAGQRGKVAQMRAAHVAAFPNAR